jgi:2,3-bisphosphoglycerate-independent phosphoglycerate mutase
MKKIPTVLLIMDGYGLAPASDSNAISLASTPHLDELFETCPHTTLSASGEDVGLPQGQIGNSEVGHTNIGAGRVVFQDLPRISNAIKDGSFFENPVYLSAMAECKAQNSALHLMGLVSNGGVHSHNTHLYALLEMARRQGLKKVYVHAFLDGRDVSPTSGLGFVRELADTCAKLETGKIATVQGRFYAMDRDKRWERLQRAYDAMVRGKAPVVTDPVQAVADSYDRGVTDEFVEPVLCVPEGVIRAGDSVICFNFRPDRAREITWALTGNLPEGHGMDVDQLDLHYVCTTQYDEGLEQMEIAFPPEHIDDTLGEYVSSLGLTQLRIAETEKYAHVTFFFNGGVEKVYTGEDRVLIPSPKEFPTYDLIPQMSAEQVTDEAVRRIESGAYDLVIMNLANCDMVGHTGVIPAAIKAVETVDTCVGRVVAAVRQLGGTTLITADHGNADKMREPDGKPCTAHTTNLVPFIVVGADVHLKPGRLADIAPTILALMGLEKPKRMTGESLIV